MPRKRSIFCVACGSPRKNNAGECRDCTAAYQAAYGRQKYRKQAYGIEPHEFMAMLESQNYACGICKTFVDYSACLDHDHKTLLIRGVLCDQCNKFLGWLEKHSHKIDAAITYVQSPPAYAVLGKRIAKGRRI